MLQENSKEKFLQLFHEILDNTTIRYDTCLKDTALDSLKYISLVVKLEKIFNMKFDDENLLIHNFTIVEDLYHYVMDRAS